MSFLLVLCSVVLGDSVAGLVYAPTEGPPGVLREFFIGSGWRPRGLILLPGGLPHRHHRQGGEDPVVEIHLQGHAGEHGTFGSPAAHRTHEPGPFSILEGVREHLGDKLRAMPVSIERDVLDSTTWPPCIRSQVAVMRSGLRLRIAAPVLIPLFIQRAGNMASSTGSLAPTPATPRDGMPKRSTRRRGHLRTLWRNRSPRPLVRGWRW